MRRVNTGFREGYLSAGTQQALAKRSDAGLRHLVVLVRRASAHSYRPDHLAITHQRNAAGEDDDPAAVRGVDAEERLARLGHLADLSCGKAPPGRGEGLVYGDVDARHPGPVHPLEGHQVPSSVHHGYVHRLAHLLGLVLSGRNDSLSFFERDHCVLTSPLTDTSSTTTRRSHRSIIADHAVSLVCLPHRTPPTRWGFRAYNLPY